MSRTKGSRMALYEHVFMARQDISQSQVETLIKEYADVVTEGGGKVGKVEYWGVKNLAYKIKKNRKAHYAFLAIDAPHPAVAEMERQMGISVDVLRYLTVKVEAHETEPSAMMRKSDRDDRRGPGAARGPREGGFRDGGGGGGFRGDREGGGGGFRGDREGGFRGGDRDGGGFRGGRGRSDEAPRSSAGRGRIEDGPTPGETEQ